MNSVFFSGLDENPDFSRSACRPVKKEKTGKIADPISESLTIGGSNAKKTAEALANLDTDSYKLARGGWKLTYASIATIIPDLKKVIEMIPESAPVISSVSITPVTKWPQLRAN